MSGRKRWLIVLLGAVLMAFASAAPAGAADRQERAAKRALERAEQALRGELGKRDVTLALRALALSRSHLRGADARRARALFKRPTDPGGDGTVEYTVDEEEPVCGGTFCIHYVASTEDAPDLTDAHGAAGTGAPNGVPDYIDLMLREFEHVGTVENAPSPAGLGWGAPVPDGDAGGGEDLFDVYVAEIGDDCCFGYADIEPVDGTFQWPSYMVMDDDYAIDEFGYADPLVPLQVTAAHEYNHVLQFAIDGRFDGWIGESVATWMEEKVYPDGNDWQRYMTRWAALPEAPITHLDYAADDDPYNIKPYGTSLFIHWLSDRYGNQAVREAFEDLTTTSPLLYSPAAVDDALALRGGTTMSAAFARFAAATAEWRTPESGVYEGDELTATVRRDGALADGTTRSGPLDHTAMRFYDVPQNGTSAVKLTVTAPADTTSALALVGRRGPETTGTLVTRFAELPAGGTGSVVLDDFGSFDRVTAVLVNADTKVDPASPYLDDLGVFDWRYLRDGGTYTARLTSDLDAPTTTVIDGPSGDVSGASQTFRFTADEAGATFACSLDGAAFTPCASPATYGGLGAGGHTFAVRATDAEGNVESAPARVAFRIVAPAAAPPPAAPVADIARLTGAALRDGAGALIDRLSWRGLKTLRSSGPRYLFTAPSAGRLTLTLKNGKKTLATLTRQITRAGVVRGRLRATKAARRGVLRKVKPVRATLTMRFTPTGGKRAQVTRRVTLTR
jgi:hypothetical protein